MNFKMERDGTYSVLFKAEEMPSVVRMVKEMELWKQEQAATAIKAVQVAENQLLEVNPQPTKEV